MTRIEKETVISALRYYSDYQSKREKYQIKKGELGEARKASKQKNIAKGLMFTFADILTEPANSVKI